MRWPSERRTAHERRFARNDGAQEQIKDRPLRDIHGVRDSSQKSLSIVVGTDGNRASSDRNLELFPVMIVLRTFAAVRECPGECADCELPILMICESSNTVVTMAYAVVQVDFAKGSVGVK